MSALSPQEYLKLILTARVYDITDETPLEHDKILSEKIGRKILLKREDKHSSYSYKIRGAYNKIAHLSDEEKARGMVVASAGNHAIGVAISAKKLQCSVSAVMPNTTPEIKVNAVRQAGAKIILYGETYQEALEHAIEIEKKENRIFVNAFDDPFVIAGQGTIAREIVQQYHTTPIEAIFVPVGGGGLISGIATYIKQIKPDIKIIGVEPTDANALTKSLKAKRRVQLKEVGLFADGVAVKQVGKSTFDLCQQFVDATVCVNTDEICAAMKHVFEETRTLVEPAGALAVAGISKWLDMNSKQFQSEVSENALVAIISGANLNFDRLRHISERAEIGERREAIFSVTIPEAPGSFRKFCQAIGPRAITEFNYRYASPKEANIFVGIRTTTQQDVENLLTTFTKNGLPAIDFTDNEIAKVHIRHMIGGRNSQKNERIFSFIFPEKIGALQNFLNQLGMNWNISLFHYRNHGSDYGRVLCGIQVPPEEESQLNIFLQNIGYSYQEETSNLAYKSFLNH